MIRKILIGLLIVFIIAQFIQPPRNRGSAEAPTDIAHAVTLPDSIRTIFQTACYDCHSDRTNYPWYSYITPVNWWLKKHIDDGKQSFNFSKFTTYERRDWDHALHEIAKTVKNKSMPLHSYLWMHDEADLTDAQRGAITEWVARARKELR